MINDYMILMINMRDDDINQSLVSSASLLR